MRNLKKTNKKSYYALLKKEFHGSFIVSKRSRQISDVRLSNRISKGMAFIIIILYYREGQVKGL
jgi:hypothetical protein